MVQRLNRYPQHHEGYLDTDVNGVVNDRQPRRGSGCDSAQHRQPQTQRPIDYRSKVRDLP